MRETTLALLRCPAGCGTELIPEVRKAQSGRILEGCLCCPDCQARYEIEEGIGRLLPSEMREEQAGSSSDSPVVERKRREMRARDAQTAAYDRMLGLALFGKLEIPVTLTWIGLTEADTLLEAGCGTGRMSGRLAARCRSLIAVDFSWNSLLACSARLQRAGISNADLIQADVCALPFQDNSMTRVASCQVLEHVPTRASRAQMVSELARVVRHGGRVVLSAYKHSLATRLLGRKEGEHPGGIYYYRFHYNELRTLLESSLHVEQMTGALVYHYLARCSKPSACPASRRQPDRRQSRREQ